MSSIFTRDSSYTLDEVHQYVADIDRLTFLRDKEKDPAEYERLANIVTIAKRVLERILEKVEE